MCVTARGAHPRAAQGQGAAEVGLLVAQLLPHRARDRRLVRHRPRQLRLLRRMHVKPLDATSGHQVTLYITYQAGPNLLVSCHMSKVPCIARMQAP